MNHIDNPNILIVDDKPENILVMENVLQRADVNILSATSGNEALARMLEYPIALVLMDVQMSDMDGFETADLMRKNSVTNHIPIIFVTAIDMDRMHVFKGYQAGAVDYLFKPLDTDILKSKVKIFLQERLKVLLQMAGATAHELNQPLMSLLGNLDLLEMNKGDPKKTDKYVSKIRAAGYRISVSVQKIQGIRYDEIKKHDDESAIINVDQKIKILVVENDVEEFRSLKSLISDETPIIWEWASNSHEAMTVLEKNFFDLIFLNYVAQDGSAFEFLIDLKKRDIDTPVIMITARDDETFASQIVSRGAYEYLPKNKISDKSVMRIISNTMEKARLKAELKKVRAVIMGMSIKK